MVTNEDETDKIIDEYLSNGISKNLISNILKVNPSDVYNEYIDTYNQWKISQQIKSNQEYKKCVETPVHTQINFNEFKEIEILSSSPRYKYLLSNVISKLREIGRLLGPKIIANLQTK
jgi:hypothetical protein